MVVGASMKEMGKKQEGVEGVQGHVGSSGCPAQSSRWNCLEEDPLITSGKFLISLLASERNVPSSES